MTWIQCWNFFGKTKTLDDQGFIECIQSLQFFHLFDNQERLDDVRYYPTASKTCQNWPNLGHEAGTLHLIVSDFQQLIQPYLGSKIRVYDSPSKSIKVVIR